MAKYLLILSALFLLATGCEDGADDDTAGLLPVAFTASTGDGETTRAGVTDNTNLASIGVFAYYTEQSDLMPASAKPDFMYNQPVNKSGSTWTYTPVKYWSNTAGDKISFFAYAPHTDKVSGLTVATANTSAGYPKLSYTVPTAATSQTDLLAAAPLLNRTKEDAVAFRMGHTLTHVIFRLKATADITVTRLAVKGGKSQGELAFTANSYAWTSFSGTTTFTGATSGVPVAANTTTEIAGFFLLPSNGTSLELTFTESGTTQTETVDLPASPLWEMNKTVAYTLNIENKTQITLEAKVWDSSSVNGTMGEEVPTSGYPFTWNGIIYESATKSYYVGGTSTACTWGYSVDGSGNPDPGWYQWSPATRICRGFYSSGPYGASQWRLPNKDELTNIVSLQSPGSSYWSITDAGNGRAWKSRGPTIETAVYETGHRLICVRDMGDLTYPTVRQVGGISVIYLNSSKFYMVAGSNEVKTQDDAISYCSGLSHEGYSDWRLPSFEEATWVQNLGVRSGTTYWTSGTGKAIVGDYKSVSNSGGGWFDDPPAGVAKARTYCVRDY